METKLNLSAISAVLIAMAAASLFIMLSLNQMNYLVTNDLYNFGLQFSYRWAMPYWILSGIVFGLSWINIALSIIIGLYIFKKRKQIVPNIQSQSEKTETSTQSVEEAKQTRLSEYVEPQSEVISEPQSNVNLPAEEVIEEEAKETKETMKTESEHQTGEVQTEQKTEEQIAPPQGETEEPLVQTESTEQRQSVL